MKILIADDSQFMRTILKGIIEKSVKGVDFVEASNGKDAIQLALDHNPDLILLDLVMPEMGGIEVLQQIGASKNGKIIVISAMGQEKVIEQAMSLGAAAFITKPFDEKKVIEVVKTVTGG